MDVCIPKVTIKSRNNLPWLTKSVTQAMRKHSTTFHNAKRSKSFADWEKYKIVRNKVVAMLQRNKRQHFYKLRFSPQKEFWKAVKVINKYKTPQFPPYRTMLQSPPTAPKQNCLTITFMAVSITLSHPSAILLHLILKTVHLIYFVLKKK